MSLFTSYGVIPQTNPSPVLFTTDSNGSYKNVGFVVGFLDGGSSNVFENEVDDDGQYNTRLFARDFNSNGTSTWVTDIPIDLTNYSTIKITWANTGTASADNISRLNVSTSKTSNSATFNAQLSKTNTFAKTTETLDISGLSGKYYIRVHAFETVDFASITSSIIKLYKIELEV